GFDETAIFIVNVDGTNLHQLTLWSELAGDPDWSPDGSKIVYSTHPLRVDWGADVESELITIRPDGSGRTVLTKFGLGGPRGTNRDGRPTVKRLSTRNSRPAVISLGTSGPSPRTAAPTPRS